ncbi:MAG: MFS transporter [Burkholderiales bacterium]|nr:MFS transporter [Burkholderiales bacterium]
MPAQPQVLRSKLFWVALLYFSSGFPLGVFYEIFPVWFRQQGVELKSIGAISLLGLAWTLKFLWAPAVDHYRHHRLWMAAVDIGMGIAMLAFAYAAGVAPWVWTGIAVFTVLSATNDIAIDGYTIEMLDRDEIGLANGVRIGFARVGMLASGGILILSDYIGWRGAFWTAAALFAALAVACLAAPREAAVPREARSSLAEELGRMASDPRAAAGVVALALFVLWLLNNATKWSADRPLFWPAALGVGALAVALAWLRRPRGDADARGAERGPMFGALMELLARPHIGPTLAFVLIFKLGDASMGFMVKPFWVDSGFTATDIGLVSVNIGLALSIAGGLVGGWYVDRAGIFRGLWVLGLWQAASNLGYVIAASVIPPAAAGAAPLVEHRLLIYAASATESFTGGLGTAAFLAFLMAIVDKRRSATEYALLSSVFALSRSLAGWASGFGAQEMGYAPWFLLTFLLSFPAYLLLPWVRRMLDYAAKLPGQH